jgi:hypothetical protein
MTGDISLLPPYSILGCNVTTNFLSLYYNSQVVECETLNWSNKTGLYCLGEGISAFVTTGHFSVSLTLAGKAVLATPVLAQDAAATAVLEFR